MNVPDGLVAAVLRFVEDNGGGNILPHGLPLFPGTNPDDRRWLPKTTINERCAYRVQLLGELGYSVEAQIAAALSVVVGLNKVTLQQVEQQLGAQVRAAFESHRPPNAFDLEAVQRWLAKERSEAERAVELLVRADLFGWYSRVFCAYTFVGGKLLERPVLFPPAPQENWQQRRTEWNQSLALLDADTIECAEGNPSAAFAELVVLYQDAREHFSEQATWYWVSLQGEEEAARSSNAHRLHLTLSALHEMDQLESSPETLQQRLRVALCWLNEHAGVDCDGWRGISALPGEGGRLDLMIAPVNEILNTIAQRLAA